MHGCTWPSTVIYAYLLAERQPPAAGPSFQKSPRKMGFLVIQDLVFALSLSRCSGVGINFMSGFLPTGM